MFSQSPDIKKLNKAGIYTVKSFVNIRLITTTEFLEAQVLYRNLNKPHTPVHTLISTKITRFGGFGI